MKKTIAPILCVLLFLVIGMKRIFPAGGGTPDFYGIIEEFTQKEGIGQNEKDVIRERIEKWMECGEYEGLNEFKNSLNKQHVESILRAAMRSDIICEKKVPIAMSPDVFGQKTLLTLPVSGIWHVVQGNKGIVSHLKGTEGEFAWDFIIMKRGRMANGKSDINENHYSWDQPIMAPAPGKVVKIVNNLEDHLPYTKNPPRAGNHVYIDHENGEISLLYHLKKNSIIVKPGDYVSRGQEIGRCGDTGISMFPHLHFEFFKGNLEKHRKFQAHFFGYFKVKFKDQKDDTPDAFLLQPAGIPQRLDYVLNASEYVEFSRQSKN